MSYKSSIDIVTNGMQMVQEQLNNQEEKNILKAVAGVGINVDKDELIKALHYDRNQYKKGYEDACSRFKWIPVEERLPEVNGFYTVCFDDEFITTIEFDGDWILWAGATEVVAWMPLPKPYRKEEQK